MFKRFVIHLFYKHHNLNANIKIKSIEKQYNAIGMVKPNADENSVKYFATPALSNRKCLIKSRKRYGFKKGDDIDKVLDNIYKFYEINNE